jgi:hypothetical protein
LALFVVEGSEVELVMWKSDIQMAYQNLWLSPEWQAKQVVLIGNKRYVDHCNCFGDRGLYKVFLSFSSLLTWIAENVKHIPNLKVYVDDNCSFGPAGSVLYYAPYRHYFPSNQARLLLLWDKLNVPHEEKKQIYGPIVPFVGFDIDPNRMTISISNEHWMVLVDNVLAFAKPGKHHLLCDFQSIARYINWSLAVFPLLRPCLSAIYTKVTDKNHPLAPIHVNNAICIELQWFTKHVCTSNRIFMLEMVAWDPTTELSNVTTCYVDACLRGMAFWYPERELGFQCCVPIGYEGPIFYWEAVAVACAMLCSSSNCLPL